MTEAAFNAIIGVSLATAAIVSLLLRFIAAPYGRHSRSGWGPALPSRLGWILMEAPSALAFAACFALGAHRPAPTAWIFLAAWEAHYVHRSFIYPLGLREDSRGMPVSVIGMGAFFNLANASLNGYYLFTLSRGYGLRWLADPRFIAGAVLFVAGFAINRWADRKLRLLRAPGESGYKIPYGGLYRYVSSPNYLGEIIEWCGWAVATWSLAGLTFAAWTAANLVPRARSHHRWYREHFPDYPAERRALLPGVW